MRKSRIVGLSHLFLNLSTDWKLFLGIFSALSTFQSPQVAAQAPPPVHPNHIASLEAQCRGITFQRGVCSVLQMLPVDRCSWLGGRGLSVPPQNHGNWVPLTHA